VTVQFQTFDEMAAVLAENTPHALVQDWWGRLEHVIRCICARQGAPPHTSVARLIDKYLSLHAVVTPDLIRELHQMRKFRNRCAHGEAPAMTAQDAEAFARRAWKIGWDVAADEETLVV
jgi:hypothetical protein